MAWEHEAEAEVIRLMIAREGDFTNHRVTWFVTLQGLLFAALGFAWKDGKPIVPVIALLGLLTALILLTTLLWGHRSIASLEAKWKEFLQCKTEYKGPGVIGYQAGSAAYLVLIGLPILFVSAWTIILIIWLLNVA